jgi:predicted PurR-regulated permease PerM
MIKVLLLTVLMAVALNKPVFDFTKSYVTQLTNFNFNDQINKIRQATNYVSLVLFYKYNDGQSLSFASAYDDWCN